MNGVVKEPPLIAKGEPNMLWRNWYSRQVGMGVEQARLVQMDRIKRMEEPSLTTASGKPNPSWVLWWRAQHNVSKNIALSICQGKIDGTYVKDKRLNLEVDGYLRKLDRQQGLAKRNSSMASPRHNNKPFIMIKDRRIEVDGRLGSGEIPLGRLCNSKLGLKELERIQNLDDVCENAVLAVLLQCEQR